MSWVVVILFPLFRGVRLALGKRGVSVSLGVPGATINLGRRGRATARRVDQVARQVGKDRFVTEAAGVRIDRQLPTQNADVART